MLLTNFHRSGKASLVLSLDTGSYLGTVIQRMPFTIDNPAYGKPVAELPVTAELRAQHPNATVLELYQGAALPQLGIPSYDGARDVYFGDGRQEKGFGGSCTNVGTGLSYGTDLRFQLHLGGEDRRSLLKFDLAMLPADTRVVQALLLLHVEDFNPKANLAARVIALKRRWSESTVGVLGGLNGTNSPEPPPHERDYPVGTFENWDEPLYRGQGDCHPGDVATASFDLSLPRPHAPPFSPRPHAPRGDATSSTLGVPPPPRPHAPRGDAMSSTLRVPPPPRPHAPRGDAMSSTLRVPPPPRPHAPRGDALSSTLRVADKGWVPLDITPAARNWVGGLWLNRGLAIELPNAQYRMGAHDVRLTASDSPVDPGLRPRLILVLEGHLKPVAHQVREVNADVAAALAQAKEKGKPVLCEVLSAGSLTSRRFEMQVLNGVPGVAKFIAQHFIEVRLDADRPEHKDFLAAHGVRRVPSALILTPEGERAALLEPFDWDCASGLLRSAFEFEQLYTRALAHARDRARR